MLLAHGKAFALLATLLERAGVVPAKEFGELLAIFSVLVGEENEDQGHILAVWASTIKEAGEALDQPAP